MRKSLLLLSLSLFSVGLFAQEEKKEEFKPSIKYGIGLVGQTSYQQTSDDQGYTMNWAGLKKGFVHTNVFLTPKLSGKLMVGLHSPQVKVFDFHLQYDFNEYIGVKAGRFKGAGPRTHFQDAIYDQEFTEIPYSVTEFARGMGVADFRRYGIQLQGDWEFINYKLFWHDSDGLRRSVPSQQFIDKQENQESNVGLKLTNFDLFLSFTPLKDAEFGGHVGRSSLPGMGRKSVTHHSLFFYYRPNNFEFKADYLSYPDVIFDGGFTPDSDDFSYHSYNTVNKKGYSLLAGYNFNSQWKASLRYEHFDHGSLGETPSKNYEELDIYTAGITFFPLKGNKRTKLVLFYEHFDESKTTPGFDRPNDIIALSYQLVLIR
ncbi:MAG: hypothetical protein L0J45_06180 [Psychroflexus sp.]|nr:hypothetical protein [Psychroflexus sp.]